MLKVVLLDAGRTAGNVERVVNLDSKLCSIWEHM